MFTQQPYLGFRAYPLKILPVANYAVANGVAYRFDCMSAQYNCCARPVRPAGLFRLGNRDCSLGFPNKHVVHGKPPFSFYLNLVIHFMGGNISRKRPVCLGRLRYAWAPSPVKSSYRNVGISARTTWATFR